MKSIVKIIFSLVVQMVCMHGQSQMRTEVDVKELQVKIVEKLTGKAELWEGETFLKSRGTREERRRASAVLIESLEEIGLRPEVHAYAYPNVNFLVDLLFDPFRGKNIYSIIPATIPSEEYIIVGAHYDSEKDSPGADDNGSGVALTLAVGYEINKLEFRNRNVMLVFFDQEESDEIGSKAFAKYVQSEGYKIHSVHVADMVGWDEDGDRAVELSPKSNPLIPIYIKAGNQLGIPIYKTNVMSSDHKSFYDAGHSALLVTEEYLNKDFNPYYHSPEDQVKYLDWDYLYSCTELVQLVLKEILTQNVDTYARN